MEYQIENGILLKATGKDSEAIIPDSVTEIRSGVFKNRSSLEKVVFPAGIEMIGSNVFSGCKNLKEVQFLGPIKIIPSFCFKECKSLKSISFPEGLECIGSFAFSECESLESVTFPEGTLMIGSYAFSQCTSLKSISFPTSIKTIDENAFGRSGIEEVHIKDFCAWCKINFKSPESQNTYVTFEKARKLYLNGKLVEDVTFPDGIEEIKRGPFSSFSCIKTLAIPEGVVKINSFALKSFYVKLEKISFPASLKTIEHDAISMSEIKEVHIKDLKAWCEIKGPYDGFGGGAEHYYIGNQVITDLVIPNGIESIGDRRFAGISSINSVTLPEGLKEIGKSAFARCTNLKILHLPKTLQQIKENAFFNCSSLKEVHIPSRSAWSAISFGPAPSWGTGDDGNPTNGGAKLIFDNSAEASSAEEKSTVVTIDRENASLAGHAEIEEIILTSNVKKIEMYAFRGCTNLRKITIPKSVKSIWSNPFAGCKALEEVHLEDLTAWLSIPLSSNQPLFNNTTKIFVNGVLLEELIVPGAIKDFRMNFRDYPYLKKVVFQDGTESIHDWAFVNCQNLKEVILSNTIHTIGGEAFAQCSQLERIVIPRSVRTIYSKAFKGTGLTEITLPATLTKVADQAFADCPNLTSIRVESYAANVQPDGLFPGTSVFANCHALKDISFDERVTIIWERMFANCFTTSDKSRSTYDTDDLDDLFDFDDDVDDIEKSTSSTSISTEANTSNTTESLRFYSIPDHIAEIRHAAFSGCDALQEVSIPGKVRSITADAFGEDIQTRVESGFIVQIRGKAGFGLNEFIKKNKGYKNFYFSDMLCREIPEAEQKNAIIRIAKWVEMGKPISAEVYESYVTYLKQNKANWLRKNTLTDENYPVYRMMMKERILSLSDTEKLIKLTNENQAHELQVLFMNYQNETFSHGDYDSLFDDSVSGDGLAQNDEESDWLVDSTGTLVVAFEKAAASVKFPETVNRKKIIGIGNGFVFSSGGKSATKKIKSIVIPEGYTSIGEDAFKDCIGLQTISMPDSIEEIKAGAFSGCEKLESLVIPKRLAFVGKDAFHKCSGLTNVCVQSLDQWMQINFESGTSNPLKGKAILHIGTEDIRNLIIPEGTTTLKDYLFAGYAMLNSIVFPNSLKSIGTRTFAGCTGISNLLYPPNLSIIGEGAFESCEKLVNIIIPEWVSTIGPNAFSFCTGIKTIQITSDKTKLGNRAFSACGSVESAELSRSNTTSNPVFDYTNIRRLIIHDYNWQLGCLGSMGSIIYTDQTNAEALSYNGKKDPRIRTMKQLIEDSTVTEDDQTLKGLTFVAAGDLNVFPEGSDYYQKEYKYYRYKDWEDTGDIIEGYREVKKYPKREDLKAFVELRGGRVTSSMSGKTDFLICNSKSAKNEYIKEAARRIIPVVDEETFIRYALTNRFLSLKQEHSAVLDEQKETAKNMLPEERELISYELKLKQLESELEKVREKKAKLQAEIKKQ